MPQELLALLCGLTFLFAMITVVGHGIWVLFAKLFGRSRRAADPFESGLRPLLLATNCPACGTRLDPVRGNCPRCGWQSKLVARTLDDDLAATERQLDRFWQASIIDAATHQQVLGAVREARRQLSGPPVAVPVVLRPVEPPPFAVPVEPQTGPPVPAVAELSGAVVPAGVGEVETYRVTPAEPPPIAARPEFVAERLPAQPPSPPPSPKRPFSEVFAAFLEQKNIRWGELIGGLLIVGSSIALVFSLWEQIAHRPFLQFFAFTAVTGGLFGVGLYTEHRWKLPTTSRGLLVISTLLVPLNFLAIAAVPKATAPSTPISIAAELLVMALFLFLLYRAGRVVVPDWPELFALGVLGSSAAELIIRRYVDPTTGAATLMALGAIPLACGAGPLCGMLWRSRRWPAIGELEANALFTSLGTVWFAALMPLGLLVYKTGHVAETLRQVAPLVTGAGVPVLATGLVLWRRIVAREHGGLRMAGTSVAAAGAMAMMGSVVLGWPDPAAMLPAALINAVVLSGAAILFEMPAAHALAVVALGFAYALGFLVATGRAQWRMADPMPMARALCSGATGSALAALSFVLAAIAASLRGLGHRLDCAYCWAGTGVVAALSLVLVTWRGFAVRLDPSGATWVYAVYSAAALLAARQLRFARLTWVGSALLLLAIAQGVVFRFADTLALRQPWQVALLAHASLAIAATLAVRWRGETARRVFAAPFTWSALLTSTAAAVLILRFASFTELGLMSGHGFWIAAIWLVVAWLNVWPEVFAAFQVALSASVVLAVTAQLSARAWFTNELRTLLDPWCLQANGIALALLSLAWIVVRLAVRRFGPDRQSGALAGDASGHVVLVVDEPAERAIDPPWAARLRSLLWPRWPSVDRTVTGLVLTVLVGLSIYAVAPGVAQELSPRSTFSGAAVAATAPTGTAQVRSWGWVPDAAAWALAGVPHAHAQGWGSWLLLAVVVAAFVAGLWEEFRPQAVWAIVLALATAYPLTAGLWDSQCAAASALRWTSAVFLALGSAVLWLRRPLALWVAPLRWPGFDSESKGLSRHVRGLVLLLAIAPLLGMAAYVGIAALNRSPADAPALVVWGWIAFVFVMAGVFFVLADVLGRWALAVARRETAAGASPATRHAATLALVLAAIPLLAMSLYVSGVAIAQSPVVGPGPDSLFARIGSAGSYALPLAVITLTLIGHAIRERSAGFAFAGGLSLNLTVTAAYCLMLAQAGIKLGEGEWIRLGQFNALAVVTYGLAWLGAFVWWRRGLPESERRATGGLLTTQIAFGIAINLILVLTGLSGLFVWPAAPGASAAEPGAVWGWLSFALVAVLGVAHATVDRRPVPWGAATALLFAAAALLASTVTRWDPSAWHGYHTLLIGAVLAGWALLALAWRVSRAGLPLSELMAAASLTSDAGAGRPGFNPLTWLRDRLDRPNVLPHATRCIVATSTVTLVFALRTMTSDPQHPWWSVGVIVALSVLAAGTSAWTWRGRFLFPAATLLNLAASIWWVSEHWPAGWAKAGDGLIEFVEINVIALAVGAIAWLALELRIIRPGRVEGAATVPRRGFACHAVATILALLGLGGLVAIGLLVDLGRSPADPRPWIGWLAVVAVGAALLSSLWDSQARYGVGGLYLLGLTAVGMTLDVLNVEPRWLVWTGTMVLAAYGVGTSYLWSRRGELATAVRRLGVPVSAESPYAGLTWLVPANVSVAAVVTALAFWIDLEFSEYHLRLFTAKAALAQVLAVGLLARGERRSQIQQAALAFGAIAAVAWSWAWLQPGTTGTFMNRSVVTMATLAAAIGVYGVGLTKLFPRESEWTRAAQRLCPALVLLTGMALVFVLGGEVHAALRGLGIEMARPAIAAVALTLSGLAVLGVALAVLPGADPLNLSEGGRMYYVYAAEALLGLLFMHIRLTMPWLFHGLFTRYWPLIVWFLAFLGVGLSEFFRRQRRDVLAVPLERTGAFLPVLPALGYWVVHSNVDYSVVLLLVGIVYGTLSVTRKSFGFGAAAAVAANSGLWYFLQRLDGYGFFEHPQLFLIPAALSVLAAAFLNRDRLTEAQMTTVRYIAMMTIYVSSTADIFISGVAEAPWLPMVLAVLSIAGMLAGIMLRVRAFLYLGITFLALAVFTMIYHAAFDLGHRWLLYLSGIVLGVLIIVLFALFEKKRNDILRMLDGLKEWER